MIEVSIGIRQFTEKFWKALGLWDFYKKSRQWAKEHGRRKLIMPFKTVSVKVKTTMVQTGEIIGNVLSNLTEGAIRAQYWCNKIRNKIRENR